MNNRQIPLRRSGFVPALILFVLVISASFTQSESNLAYSLQLYNAINFFRSIHTVPALRWNRTLSDVAQSFASAILSNTVNLSNPVIIDESQGINFFILNDTSKPPAFFVAASWYNESIWYDYSNPGYSPQYLNYTGMIWKSSTSVGIGTYTDTVLNRTSVIAKFYPVGNVRGRFRQNVIAKYKKLR